MSRTYDTSSESTFSLLLPLVWPLLSVPVMQLTLNCSSLCTVERAFTLGDWAYVGVTFVTNVGYWWYYFTRALPMRKRGRRS